MAPGRRRKHCVSSCFIAVVNNFLRSGKLLGQVNHTLLCMIPKKAILVSIEDYRPIALCNVLYQIISKLLANKLKPLLPKLIDFNKSAFINRKRITDSILLAHKLCHNLHTNQGQAHMCLKLDLSKAFDSLNRRFLCNGSVPDSTRARPHSPPRPRPAWNCPDPTRATPASARLTGSPAAQEGVLLWEDPFSFGAVATYDARRYS